MVFGGSDNPLYMRRQLAPLIYIHITSPGLNNGTCSISGPRANSNSAAAAGQALGAEEGR